MNNLQNLQKFTRFAIVFLKSGSHEISHYDSLLKKLTIIHELVAVNPNIIAINAWKTVYFYGMTFANLLTAKIR